jgi:galactoside O-acetyltransferase
MINAADGGDITIGNDVLIGPNVVLRASDHIFSDATIPIKDQGHCGGAIIIEDGVWIGSNVTITKNVKVGKGTVVGAGSVVTHDLSEMTVCAGVPAERIKFRKRK